jgi:hypothetical protein
MHRTRLACALVLLLPSAALAGDCERGVEALLLTQGEQS